MGSSTPHPQGDLNVLTTPKSPRPSPTGPIDSNPESKVKWYTSIQEYPPDVTHPGILVGSLYGKRLRGLDRCEETAPETRKLKTQVRRGEEMGLMRTGISIQLRQGIKGSKVRTTCLPYRVLGIFLCQGFRPWGKEVLCLVSQKY